MLASLILSAAFYGLALRTGLWLPLCSTLTDAQRDGWYPTLFNNLGSYECRQATGLPEILRGAAMVSLALGTVGTVGTLALIARRGRSQQLPNARVVS